jgi:hypothetical protein
MIGALGLLVRWPTTVMLVTVVFVMVASSGVVLIWLSHLLSDELARARVMRRKQSFIHTLTTGTGSHAIT